LPALRAAFSQRLLADSIGLHDVLLLVIHGISVREPGRHLDHHHHHHRRCPQLFVKCPSTHWAVRRWTDKNATAAAANTSRSLHIPAVAAQRRRHVSRKDDSVQAGGAWGRWCRKDCLDYPGTPRKYGVRPMLFVADSHVVVSESLRRNVRPYYRRLVSQTSADRRPVVHARGA